MIRNTNKLNSGENPPPRKLMSPTLNRLASPTLESSKISKESKEEGKEVKEGNPRSKERKDYMAANINRFNRKKEEKRSSSNTSEQSNNPPKDEKKGRYIYTFKEEIKANEKVKAQYPTTISKPQPKSERSSILEPSQQTSSISAVSSKAKQLQVNVVKYGDRSSPKEVSRIQVKSSKEILQQEQLHQSISQTESPIFTPAPSQKRLPQNQSSTLQYQAKFSEQLMNRMKNDREQFAAKLRVLESEKAKFQQSTTSLLQENYHLQGQITILNSKIDEFEHQISSLRDNSAKNNREVERTNSNNERMFKQLEERYNSLLKDYRAKIKLNSEQALQINQITMSLDQLKNSLRSAEEEIKNRSLEVEKTKRICDVRMVELRQEHEFQMKQLQIKAKEGGRKDLTLEESVRQLQREISAKDKQLKARGQENENLSLQLRDAEQMKDLYQAKCAQNNQLLSELNHNKQHLQQLNIQNAEVIRKSMAECKEKDRKIKQLTTTLSQVRSKEQTYKLNHEAQSEFLSNASEQAESQSSFQQLLKSQSEETNRLRSDVASKEEQLYTISSDNDQLRQRVRRLEQQAQMSARTYAVNLSNLNQMKEATQMMLKKRITALQAARNIH